MVCVGAELTFGEEATETVLLVPTEEPAVAKVVVAFDELDAVAALHGQLVGAPRGEVIYGRRQQK